MSVPRSSPDRSNRFHPQVEPLEDRRLCTFIIPHLPPTPLRTGGAAVLEGSVLIVVTNHPGANQAVIQDDGAGNVTVEWNGHTPPTFHGVTQIILDGKGRKNTFSYFLEGNLTGPRQLDILLHGSHSTVLQSLSGNTNGQLQEEIDTAPPPANLAKGP